MTVLALGGLLLAWQTAGTERIYAQEVLRWPKPLDVTRDFAVVEGKPIGLMPPEPVCGATLERAEWSSDGSRLLMVRRLTPTGGGKEQCELLGWSARTGRTVSYWSFDPSAVEMRKIAWLGGSDVVALDTTWPSLQDPNSELIFKNPRRHRVFLLDIASGRSTALLEGKNEESTLLVSSESSPKGVVKISTVAGGTRYLTFGAQGSTGVFSPKENPNRKYENFVWFDTTGQEVMVGRVANGKMVFDRLDPRTGDFEVSERWKPSVPTSFRRATDDSLSWVALPGSLVDSGDHGVLKLRVGKEKPTWLVVATDADGSLIATRNSHELPSVAPGGKLVLYRHQGVGMVRRLAQPTDAEWAAMQAAWHRWRAMRDCAEAEIAFSEGPSWSKGEEGLSMLDFLRAHPGWDEAILRRLGDGGVQTRFDRVPLKEGLTRSAFGTSVVGSSKTPYGVARLYGNGLVEWVPAAPGGKPPKS